MAPTLRDLLDAPAGAGPDDTMFVEGGQPVTRAAFKAMVRSTTAWLAARGVQPGDRVAVWLGSSVRWLALYFALAERRAVLVCLNPRYRAEELAHVLGRSQATRLVLRRLAHGTDFAALLEGLAPARRGALREVFVVDDGEVATAPVAGLPTSRLAPAGTAAAEDDAAAAAPSADDLSILFTTSGTTSGPKLVMHTQRTIAEHALRSAAFYGFDAPGARLLGALPLCGTFGLSSVLAAVAGGAPVYLQDPFNAPSAAALLREQRITHLFGSDEMFQRLLASVGDADRPFPDARIFGFGAFNASAADFAQRAAQRGLPLVGLYGSSELLALFSMQALDQPLTLRLQAGGRPVAGADAEVRVRDAATGGLAPPGTRGELEIRGPCSFAGYLDDPQATARAMTPDGFFRTGDLGVLREDGSFVFETRMGDAIRIGGYLVNPQEIEDVLQRIPGVAEAQVVAVDVRAQARPVAFVRLAAEGPGLAPTAEDIATIAQRELASFKVPARVWFVDAYPVTASANGVKTQRHRLREMARERLAAETGG